MALRADMFLPLTSLRPANTAVASADSLVLRAEVVETLLAHVMILLAATARKRRTASTACCPLGCACLHVARGLDYQLSCRQRSWWPA